MIGLTIDVSSVAHPLGMQVGYDEVAFSLRTTPAEFLKISNTIERKLAADLGLRQVAEISDNLGLVSGTITMTRDEARNLMLVMRALIDKYARELGEKATKQ